jgi:hypothetical protein
VSIDGKAWTNEQIRLSRSFGKAGDKATPGDRVEVQFLRSEAPDGSGPKALHTVDVELIRYPRTAPERPATPTNADLRPDLEGYRPDYQDLCDAAIASAGYSADCEDLLARLERCEQYPDPDRLALVRYVHRDPFKLEAVGNELVAPFFERFTHGPGDLELLLERAAYVLLDFTRGGGDLAEGKAWGEPVEPGYADSDLEGHLAYAEAVLRVAATLNERAFADIPATDIAFILEHRSGMLASFIEHKMLSYDMDYDRQKATLAVLDKAVRVNTRALLSQAQAVSLLVEPAFLASLKSAAAASGRDLATAVIMKRETPFGAILVGGLGRTRYQGTDYAAIFELGGDDVYANNQGASRYGTIPSAVIVDFAGDDAYETYEPFSQACGDLGVGIIVDLAGDDTYVGMEFTQGAGFLGIGILVDAAGDDTYRGLHFHQGVGQRGAGILADLDGHDRYEAHMASQAVGLPGGFGLLYDGGDGDDSYYCKGDQGTGYGTPGVFEGWGQGMGFGYRPYASGGVGVLMDRGGRDRMEAGNFSQGGGYFYGFGLLYCGGSEDDRYIGSRYAQGFGCHQAAGMMVEEGGDDRYSTRHAVAQGLSWDEAVALFLDRGGDDVYEGGSFSQGASAMNGWTLFVESSGRDTYLYTDQARAGGNSYHGGTSLSFFVDAGGGADSFPKRANDAFATGDAHSLFLDLPGTIREAASEAALTALRP